VGGLKNITQWEGKVGRLSRLKIPEKQSENQVTQVTDPGNSIRQYEKKSDLI